MREPGQNYVKSLGSNRPAAATAGASVNMVLRPQVVGLFSFVRAIVWLQDDGISLPLLVTIGAVSGQVLDTRIPQPLGFLSP